MITDYFRVQVNEVSIMQDCLVDEATVEVLRGCQRFYLKTLTDLDNYIQVLFFSLSPPHLYDMLR